MCECLFLSLPTNVAGTCLLMGTRVQLSLTATLCDACPPISGLITLGTYTQRFIGVSD